MAKKTSKMSNSTPTAASDVTEVTQADSQQQTTIDSANVETTTTQEVAQVSDVAAAPVAETVVVTETKAVSGTMINTTPDVSQSALDKLIAKTISSGSDRAKQLNTMLSVYVDKMAPRKPVEIQEGIVLQRGLWFGIREAVKDGDNFEECMKLVIAYFREYKDTVFHESRVFRFMENVNMGEADIKAFLAMLNILKIAAEVSSRKEISKMTDISRTFAYSVYTEEMRNRCIAFFTK